GVRPRALERTLEEPARAFLGLLVHVLLDLEGDPGAGKVEVVAIARALAGRPCVEPFDAVEVGRPPGGVLHVFRNDRPHPVRWRVDVDLLADPGHIAMIASSI